MASEAWVIAATYKFGGNAKSFLSETASFADKAATALDRFDATLKVASGSLRSFLAGQTRLRTSLGLTADVAEESAIGVDAAFDRMASAARRSAASIGASAAAIRREIASTAGGGFSGRANAGAIGGIGMWAGLGAAGTAALGMKGAVDLQGATVQSAIALGKSGDTVAQTTRNMQGMRSIAIRMSQITGQSLDQAMGVIATMSSAGLSAAQIASNWKPIAQFTDILHFNKKDSMSYGDAAKLGAGLTHELRMFNGADQRYGLGEVARMGYLSPHGTQELATQVRLAAPTLENLLPGSSRDKARQIVDLTAWADRMGGLQRFGAGMQQLLSNMVAPRSSRVTGAMIDLGVYDRSGRNRFFNQRAGTFDLMGALNEVAMHYRSAIGLPGGRGQAVRSLMGPSANAARNLQLLTGPDALKAFAAVQLQQRRMGSDPATWLDKTQNLVMGELSTQTGILTSNFRTLATLLTEGFIPPLTSAVQWMQTALGRANVYLGGHPTFAMAGGAGLAAAGGYGIFAALRGGAHLYTGLTETVRAGHMHLRMREGFGEMGDDAGRVASRGGNMLTRAVGSLNPFRSLPNLVEAAARSANAFDLMFSRFGMTGSAVTVFGESLGRLGLRAIPVVGDVLLLADAIRLLGPHAKSIGKVIGDVAHWIVRTGGPMVVKSFTDVVVSIVTGIRDTFMSLFNGGNGGLVGWLKDFVHGAASQFAADDAADKSAANAADAKRYLSQHGSVDRLRGIPRGGDVHNGNVVNIDKVENHFPAMKSPQSHARSFNHSVQTSGNSRSTPRTPRAMHSTPGQS